MVCSDGYLASPFHQHHTTNVALYIWVFASVNQKLVTHADDNLIGINEKPKTQIFGALSLAQL